MKGLKQIKSPIEEDILIFKKEFDNAVDSKVHIINVVMKYMMGNRGKNIRPILTLLCSRLCGNPSTNSYKASAMVELLHLATLVHDDVVDDATIRRGLISINRIWKNKISILVGDYILSKALINMISIRDFDALDTISQTAEKLSSGELLQLEKSLSKTMTEPIYFEMIKQKTASLIASSCELGAITTSGLKKDRKLMYSYGENLGIAFQIKDDLLDYLGSESITGKNSGGDVKRNMMTLPLIFAKSKLKSSGKRELNFLMRKLKKNKNAIKKIINILHESGGIKYSKSKLNLYSEKATDTLNAYPDSRYKKSLLDMVTFNNNREK